VEASRPRSCPTAWQHALPWHRLLSSASFTCRIPASSVAIGHVCLYLKRSSFIWIQFIVYSYRSHTHTHPSHTLLTSYALRHSHNGHPQERPRLDTPLSPGEALTAPICEHRVQGCADAGARTRPHGRLRGSGSGTEDTAGRHRTYFRHNHTSHMPTTCIGLHPFALRYYNNAKQNKRHHEQML